MGTVVMYSAVSVDGFIADEDDQPGPLFDWLLRPGLITSLPDAVAGG